MKKLMASGLATVLPLSLCACSPESMANNFLNEITNVVDAQSPEMEDGILSLTEDIDTSSLFEDFDLESFVNSLEGFVDEESVNLEESDLFAESSIEDSDLFTEIQDLFSEYSE